MSVIKLQDRSLEGTSIKRVMDDTNEAFNGEQIAAIMVCWLDRNGCWNFQHSTVPSCSRAVGALAQLQFNLLEQ